MDQVNKLRHDDAARPPVDEDQVPPSRCVAEHLTVCRRHLARQCPGAPGAATGWPVRLRAVKAPTRAPLHERVCRHSRAKGTWRHAPVDI